MSMFLRKGIISSLSRLCTGDSYRFELGDLKPFFFIMTISCLYNIPYLEKKTQASSWDQSQGSLTPTNVASDIL